MVLSLQGRSHRFKSCSAHKGFSEIFTVKNTKDPQKTHICGNNCGIIDLMKTKLLFLLVFLISCTSTLSNEENNESSPESSTTTSTIPIEEQLLIKNIKDGKKGVVRIVTKGIKIEESSENQLVKTQGDSSGSGFFISTDGFIVTNNHVVGGAVTIDVYIGEERNSYKSKIIGTSECDDIAILKIDLPVGGAFYFEFDEINPVLGEDILAIGFPRGDEQITYLDGIVSKEKAEGSNQWSSIDYAFEHTAEILPGSSGGPIINEGGKVVGVAYAGNSDRQEFGIPSTVVKKTISAILENTFNKTLGANGEQFLDFGMYIYSSEPNSPFDKAGFDGGELITHINGLDITKEDTMDVYCSALQTRGESSAIKFKGIDIEEGANFEASVSLDGTKADFKLTSSTTTKPKVTTTTKPKVTTTTSVAKPYFSSKALSLYTDSRGNVEYYARWRKSTVNIGILGTPQENDVSVIKNMALELSRLLNIDFQVISEEGDITFNFLPLSEWSNFEYCNEPERKYYDVNLSWSANTITKVDHCYKIGEEYSAGFNNPTESIVKECRIYHLRKNLIWAISPFNSKGDPDEYGENNYHTSRYCNNFQKVTDLDKEVILMHYSPYVSNAKTTNEVYNLLK